MKKFFFMFFVLIPFICSAQEIKVKRDSIEKECKSSSLRFLNSCSYKIDMMVNGQAITSATSGSYTIIWFSKSKYTKSVELRDIKQNMPGGTIKNIGYRKIVFEN